MSYLEEALDGLLKDEGFEDYQRDFYFHPSRKWRFDFAWPDLKLAIEVEGGTWSRGRHVRGLGFERDVEKYNEAALLGWMVLRVTKDMLETGGAMTLIGRAVSLLSGRAKKW